MKISGLNGFQFLDFWASHSPPSPVRGSRFQKYFASLVFLFCPPSPIGPADGGRLHCLILSSLCVNIHLLSRSTPTSQSQMLSEIKNQNYYRNPPLVTRHTLKALVQFSQNPLKIVRWTRNVLFVCRNVFLC